MHLPRVRFSVRRMILAVAITGVVLGLLAWFERAAIKPIRDHHHWSQRVRADYDRLARIRPPGATRGQWEFLVGWTENLHGNYGGYYAIRDPARAARFADELEDRLRRPVSVATIDWIWDEYMGFSRGRTYDRYRPTRSPDLLTAQPGFFGRPVP